MPRHRYPEGDGSCSIDCVKREVEISSFNVEESVCVGSDRVFRDSKAAKCPYEARGISMPLGVTLREEVLKP